MPLERRFEETSVFAQRVSNRPASSDGSLIWIIEQDRAPIHLLSRTERWIIHPAQEMDGGSTAQHSTAVYTAQHSTAQHLFYFWFYNVHMGRNAPLATSARLHTADRIRVAGRPAHYWLTTTSLDLRRLGVPPPPCCTIRGDHGHHHGCQSTFAAWTTGGGGPVAGRAGRSPGCSLGAGLRPRRRLHLDTQPEVIRAIVLRGSPYLLHRP